VCGAVPKEPKFFEAEYENGKKYYFDKYFSHYDGEELILDARPANLFLPYIPQRMRSMFPNAFYLVILRDPVRRAFSHWWMRYSRGREPFDFKMAIEKNIETPDVDLADWDGVERRWRSAMDPCSGFVNLRVYVEMGFYGAQIERLINEVGRERICIVSAEELFRDADSTLSSITNSVKAATGVDCTGIRHSQMDENRALSKTELKLRRVPGARSVARWLPDSVRRRIRSRIRRQSQAEGALDADTKRTLVNLYAPDVSRLKRLIEFDDVPWLSDSHCNDGPIRRRGDER
jgi:hypothetical protein